MIPDSLDFIRRGTNDEQAEYAAAHKTPAPADAGEAEAGAGQPPVSLTVPQGETGPRSSDADVEGAPASEVQTPAAEHGQERCPSGPVRSAVGGPTWSPVDEEAADLLTLVANQQSALPEPERQWEHFLSVMRQVARRDMWGLLIDQNDARELLRGEVSPNRIGAFYHRAARMGLIRRAGWNESTDRTSNNAGKPQNTWEWLGT